jgi:predicted NUDIX family phosphoesterase
MAKTAIQIRAEKLAAKFREARRPALVVEFAGVPKAGKTSTLNQVYSFLRRCGFKCEVVVERASVCPIRDKRHFNFNIWTACTTLSQLLEKTQNPPRNDDPDILFIDRGIFDSICWLSLLEHLNRLTAPDRMKVSEFLLARDWTSRLSGVVMMSAEPADCLQRENGHLPVEGPGGSIMNTTVLKAMKTVVYEKAEELKDLLRIFTVDTSSRKYNNKTDVTTLTVTKKILDWVSDSIEEKILSASRSSLPALGDKLVADFASATTLIERFESAGDFRPRNRVERNKDRVQPLPIVIVRNRSGDVLRLVRKERKADSNLHKTITIWAGGHVRREDGPNGKGSIRAGALRELAEELRIYVMEDQLKLLGAVYVASAGSTQKHMAFVFEWRAETDDVEVALCNAEFIEKSGNALSGTFLPLAEIMGEVKDGEISEDWSVEILQNLLTSSAANNPSIA